jgi:hypothetical protein
MSADCFFLRGRVRTDQRLDEGVGAGGGQLGSSARARRSLAAANPARVFSLPCGRGLKLRRTEVRPMCEPRPAATKAEMGGGDATGAGVSGAGSSSMLCARWRMLAITSSADNR